MDAERWETLTDSEYLEFHRIPDAEKLSKHPDLCAMLFLEKRGFFADDRDDIIGGAQHDVLYLNCTTEELTDTDAVYLARCGVHYNSESDGLALFT